MASRAEVAADPVNPQAVFASLSNRLPDNVLLTCDVGSGTNWYARHIKTRRHMVGSLSGGLASMGNGMPYLIAGKFAYPERPAVALVGDGAMQMLGNAALISLANYWREWANPVTVVLVLNNRDLNQVTWEQRIMEGDPKFEASQNLPDFAFDEYARLLGLIGLRIAQPDDIDRVWDEAFAADRPVVINAYTDPEVPPLPPHIDFTQAKAFISSMLKGDPESKHVIRESIKEMAAKWRK